jgi:uncharacterized membrane protein required for colicin V production
MVSLSFLFWCFILLFAIIGMNRGWARELLLAFSLVIGICMVTLMQEFLPAVDDLVTDLLHGGNVILRSALLALAAFLGYRTPNLPRVSTSPRLIRGSFADRLVGLTLGALNGFLLFGSLWFYMHHADYPFQSILSPDSGSAAGDAALRLLTILPPVWLGAPLVYFVSAVGLIGLIVVFL